MRIVIDMQGTQTESRFRGIGSYALSLSQAIARNRGEHEIILALNGLFPDTIERIRGAFDDLLPQENIRVWFSPGPVAEMVPGNQTRRNVAETVRSSFLRSLSPDIVLVTSLFEGFVDDSVTNTNLLRSDPWATVVVLYDLIPLLNPEEYFSNNPKFQSCYEGRLSVLERSDLLLSISESAKREAIQELGISEEKIINIFGAYSQDFRQLPPDESRCAELIPKFAINQRYIMYTGGGDARKNLVRLIRAFGALPQELRARHQLVLVGKMPDSIVDHLVRVAQEVGLGTRDVIFTGYVDIDDLVRLYNCCHAFVFPSLHEGLGLPPMEAMACGAPTVAANTSSLPEVIGAEEALFDPSSVDVIADMLNRVLTDEAFRTRLVDYGLQRVRSFSWDRTANLAIEHIERVAVERALVNQLAVPESEDEARADLLQSLGPFLGAMSDSDVVWLAQCLADNQGCGDLPRLLLDVSVLAHVDARTGIQRVVRSLLNEFSSHPPVGFQVVPIFMEAGYYRPVEDVLPRSQAERTGELPPPQDMDPGDVYLSLDLNMDLVKQFHPVHLRMRDKGVILNYIVYDLLLAQNPQWNRPDIADMFMEWLQSVTQLADKLICISNAVADELCFWLKENPPLRQRKGPVVTSFHLGADIGNSMPSYGFPDTALAVLDELRSRPTFLMVGTFEPRKGHEQVLAAFEELWTNGVDANLVIVGKEGWMIKRLASTVRTHSEINKRLFWLEGISDEYLEKIYAVSTGLIAASYGEGFGLPLVEAAHHKLPIIARDLPVFREVAGSNAYYFEANEPSDLAQALKAWFVLYRKDEHPKSDAMAWLTWRESAEMLLDQMLKLPTV